MGNLIGIDPGINGAIAVISEDYNLSIYDIPTFKDKNNKSILDISELAALLKTLIIPGSKVFIERQQSMPNQVVSLCLQYNDCQRQ